MKEWQAYELAWIRRLRDENPGASVWAWRNVPAYHLVWSGISRLYELLDRGFGQEFGLDGLMFSEGTYTLLQFKYRDTNGKMKAGDFGTFMLAYDLLKKMRAPGYLGNVDFRKDTRVVRFIGTNVPFSTRVLNVMEEVGVGCGVMTLEEAGVVLKTKRPEPVVPKGPARVLFPHQEAARDAWAASQSHLRSIVMPCGAGKTLLMVRLSFGKRVVIVCPLIDHVRQFWREFMDDGVTNVLMVHSGRDGTTDADAVKKHKGIAITTRASLGIFGNGYDHVFFDEAHHLHYDEREICERIASVTTLVTATPPPIAPTGHPWFGVERTYSMSWEEGVASGRICKARMIVPFVEDDDADSVTKDDSEGSDHDNLADASFSTKARWLVDVGMARGLYNTIVFVNSTKSANSMVEALRSFGNDARLYVQGTPPKAREDALRAMYDNNNHLYNKHLVLVSIDILREAVNVPACDSVFLADVPDDTSGFYQKSTQHLQMLYRAGRFFRKRPDKQATMLVWCDAAHAAFSSDLLSTVGHEVDAVPVGLFGMETVEQQNKALVAARSMVNDVRRRAAKRAQRRLLRSVGAEEISRMVRKSIDACVAFFGSHSKWPDQVEVVRGGGDDLQKFMKRLRNPGDVGGWRGVRERVEAIDPTFFDAPQVRQVRELIGMARDDTLRKWSDADDTSSILGPIVWPAQSDDRRLVAGGGRYHGTFPKVGSFLFNMRFASAPGYTGDRRVVPEAIALLNEADAHWNLDKTERGIRCVETYWPKGTPAPFVKDTVVFSKNYRLQGKTVDRWRNAAKGLLGIATTDRNMSTAQVRRLRGVWENFPFDSTDRPTVKARLDAALLEKWGTADVDAILDRIDREESSRKRKRE